MAAGGPDDPMGGLKQEVKEEVQVKTEDATLASSRCKFRPPLENFRDSTLEHCKKSSWMCMEVLGNICMQMSWTKPSLLCSSEKHFQLVLTWHM